MVEVILGLLSPADLRALADTSRAHRRWVWGQVMRSVLIFIETRFENSHQPLPPPLPSLALEGISPLHLRRMAVSLRIPGFYPGPTAIVPVVHSLKSPLCANLTDLTLDNLNIFGRHDLMGVLGRLTALTSLCMRTCVLSPNLTGAFPAQLHTLAMPWVHGDTRYSNTRVFEHPGDSPPLPLPLPSPPPLPPPSPSVPTSGVHSACPAAVLAECRSNLERLYCTDPFIRVGQDGYADAIVVEDMRGFSRLTSLHCVQLPLDNEAPFPWILNHPSCRYPDSLRELSMISDFGGSFVPHSFMSNLVHLTQLRTSYFIPDTPLPSLRELHTPSVPSRRASHSASAAYAASCVSAGIPLQHREARRQRDLIPCPCWLPPSQCPVPADPR